MSRITLIALALQAFSVTCSKPNPPPAPAQAGTTPPPQIPAPITPKEPTAVEAAQFMKQVEEEILKLWIQRDRMSWVKSTYITHDTDLLAAAAEEAVMEYAARKSAEAVQFDKLDLPADLRRKLKLLKLSQSLPAPRDAAQRAELAKIATEMESVYGKGKYCPKRRGAKCRNLLELEEVLSKSRDDGELLDAWQGWHTISPPMRPKYARYVELANAGSRELGFANLGELWKSRYDMSPAAFEVETDRLWEQVKPLYNDLHCYARARLQAKYGPDKVPPSAPIPAHLLGNMWAQEWNNVFDLLAPPQGKSPDVTKALLAKKVNEKEMVRMGEAFFVSLGMGKLPQTFWERSLFKKPADREVVCHASAWDVDYVADVRIKMCVRIKSEDFTTIHHELGHNYYQYSYRHRDPLYRDSANDGFHEGLGDTLALSVTPTYLQKIGLVEDATADDTTMLLRRALGRVAFLPFGLLIDRWRWDVFAGKIQPTEYNQRWWDLRMRYQGVKPAIARSEQDFDPGAKYHIPANVPYTRYFLASILQFQFHRALCKVAGHTGPLHTCSIYGNKEVGARLKEMMEMGQSRPWPEALKALTGEDKMDASAILAYFQPLHTWLKEQNKGQTCGW